MFLQAMIIIDVDFIDLNAYTKTLIVGVNHKNGLNFSIILFQNEANRV